MSSMVFVAGFVVACGLLVLGAYLFARSDELNAGHAKRSREQESDAPVAGVTLAPGAPGYPAEASRAPRAATGSEPRPLAGH